MSLGVRILEEGEEEVEAEAEEVEEEEDESLPSWGQRMTRCISWFRTSIA